MDEQSKKKIEIKETTDAKQMKLLQVGIGAFVSIFAGARLVAHYLFSWPIEGYSRKFGNYDENLYWVFFGIGAIWLILASISYYRWKQRQSNA